jgi:hypothetical protein
MKNKKKGSQNNGKNKNNRIDGIQKYFVTQNNVFSTRK